MQSWMTAPGARAVLAALASGGAPAALFVGGCVRDAILGRDVVDVDIATIHPPDEVMRRLDVAGIGYHTIGVDHGTVGAHAGERTYEITTLRVDVETDGRHAKVAYTDDWALDASRRDFTMNALYADGAGNVFDPLGGMEDLNVRRVRFIGDPHERIQEDALRILRFFRFNAQLGDGEIDAPGLQASLSHAGMLAGLSGERIRDELRKILLSVRPARMLEIMAEHEILTGDMSCLQNVDDLGALTGIEGRHGEPDFVRRLSILMNEPACVPAVAVRLKLSKVEASRLMSLSEGGSDLTPDLSHDQQQKRVYGLGAATWRDHVLLNWARDASSTNAQRDAAWVALLGLPDVWSVPVFMLRGSDVLDLGISPGPEIRQLLDTVEAWWVEGGFLANRAACLDELARRVNG